MSETNRVDKVLQAQRLVELATTIVAPVTLITALLVYFGWIRGKSYYGYFGINQGVLGLSVQDYLFRSTDVTLGAVLRLLTAGALLVALDRLVVTWSKMQRVDGKKRWLRASLAVCGLALIALGILSAFGITGGVSAPPLLSVASLGVGAVLALRLGSALLRRPPLSENFLMSGRVAAGFLLVFGAFWASTLYAQDLGYKSARAVDASPGTLLPLVTVFSKEFLDLPGSYVRASEILRPGKNTYYRYTGLHLLTYSNDRWFLITGRYSGNHRSSVVTLRDSEGIRVEVARPATGPTEGDPLTVDRKDAPPRP